MKKKIVGILVCMLLITTVLSVSGSVIVKRTPISTSLGDILYVGGSGPGNYSTIQDAIDAASEGDTIFVYSGTYYESLQIDKTVTLTGEDKNNTFIDGDGSGNVVDVTADSVNINGFTVIFLTVLFPQIMVVVLSLI